MKALIFEPIPVLINEDGDYSEVGTLYKGPDDRIYMQDPDLVMKPHPSPLTLSDAVEVPGSTPPDVSEGWLRVEGNKILNSDGTRFLARGVNIFDTRSCMGCASTDPDLAEVYRRIDGAVAMGATLLRFCCASYVKQDWMKQWENVLESDAYLEMIADAMDYIRIHHPSVKVILSLWDDTTFDTEWRPTDQTAEAWRKIAAHPWLIANPNVIYGICNEPKNNFDGADDQLVWTRMQACVDAIRSVEDLFETKYQHLILVQGTGAWARRIGYYVDHPIQDNKVAYEIHVYDTAANWQNMLWQYADKLPIVVGEYGPAAGYMTLEECSDFSDGCLQRGIPFTAWCYHHNCGSDQGVTMLQYAANCGKGIDLSQLTPWGQLMSDIYTRTWG